VPTPCKRADGKVSRPQKSRRILWCCILPLWLLLVASIPASVLAQTGWLTVEGSADFTGVDEANARIRATEEAHREAIYQTLAQDISLEDLFVNLRLSGPIMGAIPCGRVTASKIIRESVVSATDAQTGRTQSEYKVKIQAQISECQDPPAAGFQLEASLNKAMFVDGDPVVLTLTASKDCYYYVFNILEDERVLRLVPNQLNSHNRLTAGKPHLFPSAVDKRQGVRPIAHTPPKVSKTTEAIYVLGLRQPVDFSDLGLQEGLFGLYDGHTAFIKALVRVVATIPLGERAEQLIRYQIKATTQQGQ
jgi:hypothetical protein